MERGKERRVGKGRRNEEKRERERRRERGGEEGNTPPPPLPPAYQSLSMDMLISKESEARR